MSEKMKAWVLHEVGDISLDQVDLPHLKEHTVLVRVRAAGICGSDIPRIYRNGTYHFPTIPGHEFSGEVVEGHKALTGEEKDWIGKRVGIFPLIPCNTCVPCRKRAYEMCQHYSYLGSREDGGFAEYVRVPVWNLIELPERVSFEQAAMLEPMAVALHAIRRALAPRLGKHFFRKQFMNDLSDGEIAGGMTIAVCGLGTIGLLIVMALSAMGFSGLIGIGNKDFQKEIFQKVTGNKGVFVDSRVCRDIPAEVEQISGGADLYFECVGKSGNIQDAIASAAPGGSVQMVGNPASDIVLEKNAYWMILRRQLTVTGTWNSSFTHEEVDDWNLALRFLSQGKIHPEMLITHKLSMEALDRGFELMRDKSEPYIKVIGNPS